MDTLRCSATELDAFARWRDDEEAELEPLLAQLRRQAEPNEAMLAGHALHTALEHAQPGEFDRLEAEGYTFLFPNAAEVRLPDIREVKGERVYIVAGCAVTLVGKVDALHGTVVIDHKTTSSFEAEKFLSTYQWRVYLDVFDAHCFIWLVFEMHEAKDAERTYEVRQVHPLAQYRYPAMREDVERLLAEFVEFAREHLPERFEAAKAAA